MLFNCVARNRMDISAPLLRDKLGKLEIIFAYCKLKFAKFWPLRSCEAYTHTLVLTVENQRVGKMEGFIKRSFK